MIVIEDKGVKHFINEWMYLGFHGTSEDCDLTVRFAFNKDPASDIPSKMKRMSTVSSLLTSKRGSLHRSQLKIKIQEYIKDEGLF